MSNFRIHLLAWAPGQHPAQAGMRELLHLLDARELRRRLDNNNE